MGLLFWSLLEQKVLDTTILLAIKIMVKLNKHYDEGKKQLQYY